MMRRVMQRHPNAFLITLANFGITVPLHKSQSLVASDIEKGLAQQGRPPDSPLVIVGHSQGALAALQYALDHQDRVLHVFTVGCPWQGSVTAGFWSNHVSRITGRHLTGALRDMAPESEFLQSLHARVPEIADRITNIYSTHEIFIRPYVSAHIDLPGVSNVLIASREEYAKHLRTFPDLPIDDLIVARVTHAGEMNTPEVRSLVWQKVEDLSGRIRLGTLTPLSRAQQSKAQPTAKSRSTTRAASVARPPKPRSSDETNESSGHRSAR